MQSSEVRKPKICLVTYHYPFDRSPSLQNLVRDLMTTYTVVVYADHRFVRGIPDDILPFFKVLNTQSSNSDDFIPKEGKFKTFLKKMLPKSVKKIATQSLILKYYFLHLPRFCFLLRKEPLIDVTIAADKGSLLAAILSGRPPLLYYSLEVSPFSEEPNFLFKALHIVEYLYIKFRNPYVISQSECRINLIQERKNRQILIPVTSSGAILPKTNHLRDALGIGTDKKVLLLAGGLGSDQLTLEILTQVKFWGDQYVLVLHSASGKYAAEVSALACERENEGRVYLSRECFTIDGAEELIYASADIGIVLYKDLGFNYRHTAFASGKLTAFLRSGVPLIVPDFDEFITLIEKHRFAEPSRVHNIGEAADRILENYASYEAAAYTAYNEIFRYANYSGNVSKIIRQEILSVVT